jgi:hypothetical protein
MRFFCDFKLTPYFFLNAFFKLAYLDNQPLKKL